MTFYKHFSINNFPPNSSMTHFSSPYFCDPASIFSQYKVRALLVLPIFVNHMIHLSFCCTVPGLSHAKHQSSHFFAKPLNFSYSSNILEAEQKDICVIKVKQFKFKQDLTELLMLQICLLDISTCWQCGQGR